MAAIDTGTRVRARALEVIGQQCFTEDIGYGEAVSIDVDNGQSRVLHQLFSRSSRRSSARENAERLPHRLRRPTDEQITETVTNALKELRQLSARLLSPGN